jgi:membrane fusion protein, multidrug efflux system
MKTILLSIVTVITVLAIVVAVAFGVRTMNDNSNTQTGGGGGARGPQRVPVEVHTVELRDLRETIRGIGTLRASRVVHLSPETDGTLVEVHFREGSMIERGQPLFDLDQRKLTQRLDAQRSALRAARARLDIAQTTFDRVSRLREQNVASADEFDRARTDLEAAMSDVDQLEANVALVDEELKDTRIVAPFTGMIAERLVDAGNYVQAGQRLAAIYQLDPLEMSLRIPERHLGRIEIGQPVGITVASFPDESFHGEVTFISPAVDERSRDFLIKATVENAHMRLRPGSFGTALVVVGEHAQRPVVPEEALVPTRAGYSIFIIEDGAAQLQPVSIGLRTNGMVEITDGLREGQTVVRTGQLRLNPGSQVDIVDE